MSRLAASSGGFDLNAETVRVAPAPNNERKGAAMTSTQPDDGPTAYPDSWRRRTKVEAESDQVVEYISKLSPAELHILQQRARGDRR